MYQIEWRDLQNEIYFLPATENVKEEQIQFEEEVELFSLKTVDNKEGTALLKYYTDERIILLFATFVKKENILIPHGRNDVINERDQEYKMYTVNEGVLEGIHVEIHLREKKMKVYEIQDSERTFEIDLELGKEYNIFPHQVGHIFYVMSMLIPNLNSDEEEIREILLDSLTNYKN